MSVCRIGLQRLTPTQHLRILVKHKILNPQDVGLSKGSFELPIKGRRLLIAPEEEIAADSKRLKHFKEMFLKELTYPVRTPPNTPT